MNLQEHSAYSTLLLEHFIDQLAEYIVLDSDVLCALCMHGSCDHQMSGLTCRSGIKAWLTERRMQFSRSLPDELQKELASLDALRSTGVVNKYGAAPYLEKEFPRQSREWYKAVLRLWMETYQERMDGK